jgi:type II secretory pathway component GspD/PulD (secretin)
LPGAAQVSLDLRDASLRDFVQIVAQSTGRNFILDDRVQGSVTVVAPNTVTPDAIYEIFLNVLELNRLTIVEGDETDRIVPLDVARELRLQRIFVLTFEVEFFARHGFAEIDGTPVTAEVYEEMCRSYDTGVAEFLDLSYVKPNILGNTRMLLTL